MPDSERPVEDPRLVDVVRQMEKTGWAAALCDSELRLVWVSDELRSLLGDSDSERLGYGKHILECWWTGEWHEAATQESQLEAFMEAAPWILYDTPGGAGALDSLPEEINRVLREVEPAAPPPVWATRLDYLQGDLPPVTVVQVGVRICDVDARYIGHLIVYGSALPATVLTLVARGDEGMFARMARLAAPGRREACILFADLQMSSALSRRLPSAAYFRLISALTTAMDEVVVAHTGIVGKHAGDGVTAFFLAEDLGSRSRAVRAGIEAARDIVVAAADATKAVGAETDLVDPSECLINIGLHWGGHLYMGQLVTGGRLEVTALGDRVNECARIQQSASDGQILASKSLLEHLAPDDAEALGVDPDGVMYTPLSDLPGAHEKAARDAGGVAVTVL